MQSTSHDGPRRPSPIDIQKGLKGIHYPARKDEVLRRARENDANERVLDALQHLPDQNFKSPTDINQALSGS